MKRRFLKYSVFILLLLLSSGVSKAQQPEQILPDSSLLDSFYLLESISLNGEMVLHENMPEVYVLPRKKFKNKRHYRRFTRLMFNVKKVYPYSQIARLKMKEMELHLLTLHTEKEKRMYIDQVEKDMFAQFEGELRNLTVTQGRILIKLVDRETGDTSYSLIQELKGSFSAFFWQSVARIFGSNLKSEYDAEGEDAEIEEIVRMIEKGLF